MNNSTSLLKQDIEAMEINGAKSKRILELARRLEESTLESSQIADELFNIYLKIFTSQPICSYQGTDAFISGLFSDFEKLSNNQKNQLVEIFSEHGSHFEQEMLRIATGDLVARKYSSHIAIPIFDKMWKSGNKNLREIAYSGAQVLSRILPREGDDREALRKLGQTMDKL